VPPNLYASLTNTEGYNSGWLLRLGTVITVLAVVLDPLAQQLVQLDQSEVYEDMSLGNVSSPKALRYSKGVEQFPYATENPCKNLEGIRRY
jgi:hypothetical protein